MVWILKKSTPRSVPFQLRLTTLFCGGFRQFWIFFLAFTSSFVWITVPYSDFTSSITFHDAPRTSGEIISTTKVDTLLTHPVPYAVEYRYQVDDVEHRGVSYIEAGFNGPGDYRPGRQVAVLYLDREPARSLIAGAQSAPFSSKFGKVPLLMFLIILAGVLQLQGHAIQALRLLARGEILMGKVTAVRNLSPGFTPPPLTADYTFSLDEREYSGTYRVHGGQPDVGETLMLVDPSRPECAAVVICIAPGFSIRENEAVWDRGFPFLYTLLPATVVVVNLMGLIAWLS